MTMRAPPPSAFSASMRPPSRVMTERASDRPSPMPRSPLVVKNGSNRRGSTSGAKPGP
jgi:hypothetical protein